MEDGGSDVDPILKREQKRAVAAKLEIQKNNMQQYNQSKTQLSKRVAELEREKRDEAKRFETLRHKLEQTNADKEVLKRQLNTIKTQVKQQEVLEVK